MYPFDKYIIYSLLRRKAHEDILESLSSIGLTSFLNNDFAHLGDLKEIQKDSEIISKIVTQEDLDANKDLVGKYGLYNYFYQAINNTVVWQAFVSLGKIPRHTEFVVVLTTAGVSVKDVRDKLNYQFTMSYPEASIKLFLNMFWDLSHLSPYQIIQACENVSSDSLKELLFNTLEGKKVKAANKIKAGKVLPYSVMLETILTDTYSRYEEIRDKHDPSSIQEKKFLISVIMKVGEKHAKVSQKNTNELDDLLELLRLDRKRQEDVKSIDMFVKDNAFI